MKNKKILPLILIVFLSFFAGISGSLFFRNYLLDDIYWDDINFSNLNNPELVIREAKKVVIEQEVKIDEVVNSVNGSIVGIFLQEEIKEGSSADSFDLDNFYSLNNELGQGLIIASNGWIISGSTLNLNQDYVVITKDKVIYEVDEVINDSESSFSFLHVVGAKDFPVVNFFDEEIKGGQSVLTVNWDGDVDLNSVLALKSDSQTVESTDYFSDELLLSGEIEENFLNSFLFNLSGDIVGLVDNDNKVFPIAQFRTVINNLFENKTINRPVLGINYIDLSDLVSMGDFSQDSGAVIYKDSSGVAVVAGSSADLAGLKEGDIIISVENKEINEKNNLTYLIQSYSPGDIINMVYLRDGVKEEIELELVD